MNLVKWTLSECVWLAIAAALLCYPAFLHSNGGTGVPRIGTGDQPHYMIMLDSLIMDGDFDLTNNYSRSEHGGIGMGAENRFKAYDHHTLFWVNGRAVQWRDLFEPVWLNWTREPKTDVLLPKRQAGSKEDLTGLIERPAHPIGLPLFLGFFVWPFRGTTAVEPLALLIITLSGVLGLLLFHTLARDWSPSRRVALVVTVLAFLGTPAWHYARCLFAEELLLFFAVGACVVAVHSKRFWLAGAFIGMGLLMKPPFALLAGPLAFLAWRERKWRGVVELALPGAAGAALLLVSNAQMYGSPFRMAQAFWWANPLDGLRHYAVEEKGIFAASPVLLLALAGWPRLLRTRRLDAAAVLGCAAVYLFILSCWSVWDGGWCYGPRLVLPIMPLLMYGLLGLDFSRRWVLVSVALLGSLALIINGVAAFHWWQVSDTQPPRLVMHWLQGLPK
jgi:hypothetical protein